MKKLVIITGLLLMVVLLGTVSCGQAKVSEEDYGNGGVKTTSSGQAVYPTPGVDVEEERVMVAPKESQGMVTYDTDSGEQWATERMIVRTGNIMLVVEDVLIAIDKITWMADSFDGYVVSSRVWKEGERLVGNITVRVLAEYFDNAMSELRDMAVDVTSESSTSKDVTEEYVDLTAKLDNLEATEKQLLVIMEKAETVEDILDVQRELTNVRGEIEQTKARMQYLEQTSVTSLIEIYLVQSKLSVDFYANRNVVKVKEEIQFVADIAGGFSPYSYEWDFGDGTTSTEETPTHTYKTDGKYTISLTVTDDRGNTDTLTRTDYITVLPGWSAGNIASAAWNGLAGFGRALANIFIWLGIFSPVWIIIGVIIWWLLRRRKRKAQ
jgi:PKD repeat protein